MIGYIEGHLLRASEGRLVIRTAGGLGYVVHACAQAVEGLEEGAPVSFLVETLVKDGEMTLYGFSTDLEQSLFRVLVGIPGVGGRTALGLLALGADEVCHAIITGNPDLLRTAQGVGPRVAVRICTEGAKAASRLAYTPPEDKAQPGAPSGDTGRAAKDAGSSPEDGIRQAAAVLLRGMGMMAHEYEPVLNSLPVEGKDVGQVVREVFHTAGDMAAGRKG